MYLALKNALGKSFILFRGLLNEFSGASAAYSFRNLNNAYAGPIVEVRRDIDTNTDTNERDFSIGDFNQVADWVNGLQETTLPANVASSAAAYSLRKVNSSYSGDVVRIRRASDSAEVNVGFDSDDKVSTSSPITQTDLLPNKAGTILFDGVDDDIDVNTTLLPATDDFTLTINVYVESNPSADATIFGQGTSGVDGRTVVQIKTDGTLFVFAQGPGSLTTGNSFNLGAINTIVFSRSGTTLSLKLNEGTAVTLTSSDPIQQTNSQIADGYVGDNFEGWFQSFSVGTLTWDGTQGAAQGFGWTINGSPQLSVVIPATLGEFLTEGGNQDATVHTWYDQSGNGKDAPQDASGEQPKIASNGALLSDGILFDGDNDGLNMPTDLISSINSASAFVVAKAVETDSSRVALALSRNDPDFRFYLPAIVSSNFNFGYGTSATAISLGAANTNEHLFSATAGSSTAEAFLDGVSKGTVSSLDGKSALTADGIGGINTSTFWSGNIKEIIIYASDQSTNRFRIESNINNYYSIYTAENNGFVSKWYDQSGNNNNAVQTTGGDQPVIVGTGTLITDTSGRPAVSFGDGTDFLQFTQTTLTNETIFCKSNALLTNAFSAILSGADNRAVITQSSSNVQYNLSAGNFKTISGSHSSGDQVFTFMRDGTNVSIFQNSSAKGTSTELANSSITREVIGRRGNTEGAYTGTIGEYLLYPTARTSDRADIEANIKSHYNIS